jgi:undecaprenyl-diphosphatase
MLLFAAFLLLFLILWAVYYSALPAVRAAIAFGGRMGTRLAARFPHATSRVEPWRAYVPVVIIVVAGALVTAWAGDAFLDLAERVHARSPKLQQIDLRIHDWAVRERNAGATPFFVTMTNVGGPFGEAALVAAVGIILAVKRHWSWLIYLGVTCAGGALLNEELKRHFARARPDVAEWLRSAHGYSFPSGHAMGAMVVFGALAYLGLRSMPNWSSKAAALAFANVMIIAVSASRVYLGVHWISDVGAGITIGAVWVVVTTCAYETLRRLRGVRMSRPQV